MKIVVVYLYLLFSCSQAIELKYSLFTSTEGFDSSGAVPAIELAEEMVNRDNIVLPGYTLVHDEIKDSKVGILSGGYNCVKYYSFRKIDLSSSIL